MIAFKHFGAPPHKVMEWFDISKATLFRWEKDGLLPEVNREIHGLREQRSYQEQDLKALCELKSRSCAARINRQATKKKECDEALWEELLWMEFISGSATALDELAALSKLSRKVTRKLLRLLIDYYEVEDEIFYLVIKLVYEHALKAQQAKAAAAAAV